MEGERGRDVREEGIITHPKFIFIGPPVEINEKFVGGDLNDRGNSD